LRFAGQVSLPSKEMEEKKQKRQKYKGLEMETKLLQLKNFKDVILA
jgi:hypothetical protein